MLRLLHVSDLHLGYAPASLGGKCATRRAERDRLLERLVDLALEQEVDMVFIAGDLFDQHRPEPSLAFYAISELRRLVSAGIALVTVPGNHDEITYADSVYRTSGHNWPGILVSNPLPAHVASLNIKGYAVHLYSVAYTGGITAADTPLKDLPRVAETGLHIGIFHGSLDIKSSERSLPLSSAAFADAAYDYVALGHYHRFSQQSVGDTMIVYAGAVEARNYRDPGSGAAVIVECTGESTTVRPVPVPVREFRSVQIALSKGTEDEITALADPELALEVRLTGVSDLEISSDYLAGRWQHLFYHLSILDNTNRLPAHVIESLANELSVRGVFVRRMLQRRLAASSESESNLVHEALLKGLRAFAEVRQ